MFLLQILLQLFNFGGQYNKSSTNKLRHYYYLILYFGIKTHDGNATPIWKNKIIKSIVLNDSYWMK